MARYGGEEFVVVLPAADLVASTMIAEEVRKQVETLSIPCDGGNMLHCTISIGVAS